MKCRGCASTSRLARRAPELPPQSPHQDPRTFMLRQGSNVNFCGMPVAVSPAPSYFPTRQSPSTRAAARVPQPSCAFCMLPVTVCKYTNPKGMGPRPLHRDVLSLDIVSLTSVSVVPAISSVTSSAEKTCSEGPVTRAAARAGSPESRVRKLTVNFQYSFRTSTSAASPFRLTIDVIALCQSQTVASLPCWTFFDRALGF